MNTEKKVNDIIEKGCVGTVGFISSVGLVNVNQVLSAIVAILTIIYLAVSIYKKLSE
jgi:hypothetical protein